MWLGSTFGDKCQRNFSHGASLTHTGWIMLYTPYASIFFSFFLSFFIKDSFILFWNPENKHFSILFSLFSLILLLFFFLIYFCFNLLIPLSLFFIFLCLSLSFFFQNEERKIMNSPIFCSFLFSRIFFTSQSQQSLSAIYEDICKPVQPSSNKHK